MLTISRVESPVIFELTALAGRVRASGKKIYNLGQAVPDIRPSPDLPGRLAALSRSADLNSYSPDAGLPALKALIAKTYLAKDGAAYDPGSEIIITPGANHAYFTALLSVTDPGDEVVLFSPYYFNHGMAVELLSRKKVEVRLAEAEGWDLDLAAFRAALTRRTKAVTLVNPNNPTGAVFCRQTVEKIAALCAERGIFLISDEVYDNYLFRGRHFRPASVFKDTVITIGSLSKSLGFMGWRIGYLAAPKRVIRQAIKVQDASVICASYAGQLLAVEAIKERPRPGKEYLAGLEDRKNALRAGLAGTPGLEWREPQGALFAMVRLQGGLSPHAAAVRLLKEKGVITVPCESFGLGGRRHLRLSFGCLPEPEIRAAAALVKEFFTARGTRGRRR
ncbi:MAG: hypothetical protein A3J79_11895 [Elusimicrobia bacterium RIFOXYB2_FULL_62_6]|nr:MAG: hypothetical protein A3J79_11895 [Elusimicrobia bacterium RIFOXYB2_FULL_62_6]